VPDAAQRDAYAVLGVDRNADDKTIASAHRALWRDGHHPDLAGESATRQMMHINAAFEAIRDAAARRSTDAGPSPPPPRDGTGGAGTTTRSTVAAASSISGAMSAGRSARSRASTRDISCGWRTAPEGEPYRDEIDDILIGMGIPRRRAYATCGGTWGRFSGPDWLARYRRKSRCTDAPNPIQTSGSAR
jgi:curved DNA-binding protein CbpA